MLKNDLKAPGGVCHCYCYFATFAIPNTFIYYEILYFYLNIPVCYYVVLFLMYSDSLQNIIAVTYSIPLN